jgi:long-chain acyl-CoA synthetase
VQLTEFTATPNLVALFLARADEKGDAPFLRAKRNGQWQSISWKDTAQKVCLLAEGLIKLGLRRGDPVMLVSENRPEWAIADLAIMAAGCVTVPTYITNTERDHTHILENSGACAVIVSGAKLGKTLLPAVLRSGHGRHVIGMEPLGATGGALNYHDWDRCWKAMPRPRARRWKPASQPSAALTPLVSSTPAARAAPRAG